MTLEDDFTDILKKARYGQSLSIQEMVKHTGMTETELTAIERGTQTPTQEAIDALAQRLGLRPGPLGRIARGEWSPAQPLAAIEGLETIHGDIGGYAVKGYVVYDVGTKEAVLIDTGYNPDTVLQCLDRQGLTLTAVCLTHGHSDHAGGLDRILRRHPAAVWLGRGDFGLAPWLPDHKTLNEPEQGRTLSVGRLTIECMATPGHTPGGMCYRVLGGPEALCCVGDTLFAGSIGRANPFNLYHTHLASVRQKVLTLPEGSILLPGHGPGTTVAEELRHNPFGQGF